MRSCSMMWDFGWDFGLAIGFPSLKNERDAVTRGWGEEGDKGEGGDKGDKGEEGDKGDKGDWDIEISEFRIPNSEL